DRLLRLARGEGQRAAGGRVVRAGLGGAVGRGVLHGDRLRARGAQRHDEREGGRAAVALVADDVGDEDRAVVVPDRPPASAVGDGVVGRVAQVDVEEFVLLDGRVAVDRDGDRLLGLTWGEAQGGQRQGRVIAGRGGGDIGRGGLDGDDLG